MRLGARRLTWPEVCEGAGVEHAVADLLWRALGFPDVPPDERAYTDDDLRALQIAAEGIGELTDGRREAALELVVGEARAVSAHLTRIAEIEVDAIAQMSELGLRERTVGQAFERGLARSDLGWLLLSVCAAASTRRSGAGRASRRDTSRSWRSDSLTLSTSRERVTAWTWRNLVDSSLASSRSSQTP